MNAATSTTLQNRLGALIQFRNLLTHPFYKDWQAGLLSMDNLRLYATQYYHFEVNFPRFLSAVHSHCNHGDVRQLILDNLWDEEHGNKNHRSLWLDFTNGLGLIRGEMEAASATPSIVALCETYNRRCLQGFYIEGLAAIHAYKSQVPQVMDEQLRGLQEIYGVTDSAALKFFEVHRDLDRRHAAPVEEATQETANS